MSVAAKLLRNSVFAAAGRLWTAATSLFVMPYMRQTMGDQAFGVYQMFLILVTFLVLADAGLSTALPKYVAEYVARDDREDLADVVNTGVAFYLTVALVGMIVLLALTGFYLRLIRTPDDLMLSARASYFWFVAMTGFTFTVIAFRGILTGLQRVDLINAVEVAVSVPTLIATVWVLAAGKGILGMAIVQFSQYAVIGVGIIIYCVRLLPAVSINPFRATRGTFALLMRFGWRAACPSMGLIVQGLSERLMLANFLGPGLVTMYTFGQKVPDVWRGTFYPVLNSVVPAASHLDALDASGTVLRLYERGTKFFLAVVYPVAMWLFVITPLFITAWMGRGYGLSMLAMRLLLIGVAFQFSAGVCVSVARGLGQLKPDLVASGVIVAVELALGFTLGRKYGYAGILVTGTVAFMLNALTSIVMVHRSFGWPLAPAVMRLYLPPLLVSALASAPLYWYNHINRLSIVEHEGVRNRLALCGWGVVETLVFAVIYIGVMWLIRYATPADLQSLRRASRGLRKVEG